MTTDTAPAEFGALAMPVEPCAVLPPPALRRALRKLAGATQEELAEDFGVTDGTISCWERSPQGPGRRHQRRYLSLLLRYADDARELGVPIQWPGRPTANNVQK